MFVVIWLIYGALKDEFYMVIIAQQLTLWQLMSFVGNLIFKVILRIALFYLLVLEFLRPDSAKHEQLEVIQEGL